MGKNSANPMALILSAVHMLRHVGLESHADRISAALMKVVSESKVLTPDVGGKSTTSQFTEAVIANLKQ